MKSLVFESLKIGNRTMPNRFVAQAMEGNDGENGGLPSQRTINRYAELAGGGWGAALIEAVSVSESSLARVNCLIINKKNLDGMKRLVETYKKRNDEGLLFMQITHSGERSGPFSEITTLTPGNENGRYLSSGEIEAVKDRFIDGALLAKEAGVDGIDLKMCHGYFGAEMLRPSNTRDDKWGGSFENRTRFLREIAGEIRSRLGAADFILGSRISMYEGIRGGCGTGGPDEIVEDIGEMLRVVRTMNSLGMDYVNVSAGIPALTGAITRPTEPSKYLALHQLRYAKTVKQMVDNEKLNLKVIGSAYTTHKAGAPGVMEEMLCRGYADACGFGRQIFADPLTPKKIREGEKVNWCLLCSGCSKLMAAQLNDGCIIYNEYYKEINRNFK